MTKKRRVSPPLNTPLRSAEENSSNTLLRYLTAISSRATISPEYCAATVPAAIPKNPMPLTNTPADGRVMPNASTTLIRIFIPLTTKSVIIALTLSCIPMNQPLRAIRLKVAGAAHILMKKYLEASSRTWGVQSTTRKAALTKIHWIRIRQNAIPREMPNALVRILAHSFQSCFPNA